MEDNLNVPVYISIVFGITTFLTIVLFYIAAYKTKLTLIILSAWIALQGLIATTGFYLNTTRVPPRFLLLVIPPLILIIALFSTRKGREYIDKLNIKVLILLHTVRIPVEIVLLWLFINKAVPELMTFEGRNFDILSGITAPIIYYIFFKRNAISRKVVIAWNVICLVLLINIVANAVLSSPFKFQQFAFDQPNIAVLYFPFIWLPCCVVPLVLFSHLVTIRHLLKEKGILKPNRLTTIQII